MNFQFSPAARPSSLETLTDQQLLDIYNLAVEIKASPEFINLLTQMMESRHLTP